MKSRFKRFSILAGLGKSCRYWYGGLLVHHWPRRRRRPQSALKTQRGRLSSASPSTRVINDGGYLVVDDSLNETQPPLHWKNKSIKLSWNAYPEAEYRLRSHDAKSDKIDDDGNYLEVYAQQANEAEEWSTETTAVRPNHASAKRFWYIDMRLGGPGRRDQERRIDLLGRSALRTDGQHIRAHASAIAD